MQLAEVDTLVQRLRQLLPPLLCTQRSSWEQGICAQALLECYRFFVDSDTPPAAAPVDLIQHLYALVHDAVVRQAPDGRLATVLNGDGSSDSSAVDPACIGESLYHLIVLQQRPDKGEGVPFPPPQPSGHMPTSLRAGAEKMLRYVLEDCPRAKLRARLHARAEPPPNAPLRSHTTNGVEIWSDTVYMLPPFLAAAAAFHLEVPHVSSTTASPRSLIRSALEQIILAAHALQSPTGEWSHIYDVGSDDFRRRDFWGVGNGWVCCGIARVLRTLVVCPYGPALPPLQRIIEADASAGAELMPLVHRVHAILLGTIRACLLHLTESNLFPEILPAVHDLDSDPSAEEEEETNLAQMLSYALFRLLDLHEHTPSFRALLLQQVREDERASWARCAEDMRAAAVGRTDRWGFVRGVCGSPEFDGLGTAAEGQAWGILMEVARAEYMWHCRVRAPPF